MKKLIVSAVKMIMVALLISTISGCGADVEDCLAGFFEEYYSECIQLCETCAEWSEMCNVSNNTVTSCIERQWYNSTRNKDCNAYIDEVTQWINFKECLPETDRCLYLLNP